VTLTDFAAVALQILRLMADLTANLGARRMSTRPKSPPPPPGRWHQMAQSLRNPPARFATKPTATTQYNNSPRRLSPRGRSR
jgi:hypothetical protein